MRALFLLLNLLSFCLGYVFVAGEVRLLEALYTAYMGLHALWMLHSYLGSSMLAQWAREGQCLSTGSAAFGYA